MPKVSIIMTSYNKPMFVDRVLEAVLKQTMPDFELLLMDDNSDYPTVRLLEEYAARDSRIRLFRHQTTFEERLATARYATLINQALEMATGEYITYLSDDNFPRPRKLEVLAGYLDRHTHINIVYGAQLNHVLDENLNKVAEFLLRADEVVEIAPGRIDHCSVMHRKSVCDVLKSKYGFCWDDSLAAYGAADGNFWTRLHWQGWKFHPVGEVLDDNMRSPYGLQSGGYKFLKDYKLI